MSSSNAVTDTPAKQPSLARLVFVSHMLLATTILITSASLVGWLKYRSTYEKVESELLGAAELMNEKLSAGVPPPSLSISDAFFHRFGKADRDHAYWTLWDKDGHLIASRGNVPPTTAPGKALPARDSKRPYVTHAYGRHLDLHMQTADGRQMMIGRPMAKEFDDLGRLAGWMFVLLSSGWALAAISSWRLATAITGPIERLANSVASIRHQELDRRLPVPQPSREMTACAAAFNAMLSDLELAFNKQRRFTADAAHELRTPVAVISGQCALSLSRPREPEQYRAALATCQRSAIHMGRLVDQLLLLSRLDANANANGHRSVRLDQICQNAIELMTGIASERDIRLTAQLTPTTVIADETQMLQVMLNLLTNAIQFSFNGGEVNVSTEQDADRVLLRVSDNGIGISEEQLPHVYDRFFQVDQARTNEQGRGSGLGLSIVSEIVRRHGGSLQIESSPGRGTTVTVRLPLAQNGRD